MRARGNFADAQIGAPAQATMRRRGSSGIDDEAEALRAATSRARAIRVTNRRQQERAAGRGAKPARAGSRPRGKRRSKRARIRVAEGEADAERDMTRAQRVNADRVAPARRNGGRRESDADVGDRAAETLGTFGLR